MLRVGRTVLGNRHPRQSAQDLASIQPDSPYPGSLCIKIGQHQFLVEGMVNQTRNEVFRIWLQILAHLSALLKLAKGTIVNGDNTAKGENRIGWKCMVELGISCKTTADAGRTMASTTGQAGEIVWLSQ